MASGKRFLDVVLRASNRRLKRDLRASKRELKQFASDTRGLLSNGFSATLGGLAGFASAQGIADMGREVMRNEEALTRVGIQAGLSEKELAKVRDVTHETARAFGLSTAETIRAATKLVDLEGAAGFSAAKIRVLAQAAVATGSDLADLAGIAKAMSDSFGIKTPDDLLGALSAVTEAGKQGSIPLREMSVVLQQISADFKKVGALGKDGAADLAAALQVARASFGSAAEAGTGLKAFVNQLEQSGAKMRAFVKVFERGNDGAEVLRPIRDIIDDIAKSPLLKRKQFFTQFFGSSEARKFLEAMVQNRDKFEELSAAARKSTSVQDDAQKFLASSAGRLKLAIAETRGEMEALFTPERLATFVDLVQNRLVPALRFTLDHATAIGVAIVGWKLAQASMLAGTFALNLGKGVKSAGGLGAVFGKMNLSSGSILRSVIGFAGPIGLATAAVWGLVEAFTSARKENEAITAETIRQKELAGETVGEISKFDPRGTAHARRNAAKALRENVRRSEQTIFADDFAERVQREVRGRITGGKVGRHVSRISKDEGSELLHLRRTFLDNDNTLPPEKLARLETLLNKAGLHKGTFSAGNASIQALAEAGRLDAEAKAEEAARAARYGKRNFDPVGFDVGAAITASGLTDPAQVDAFRNKLLAVLGERVAGLGAMVRIGPEGAAVGERRLQIDDRGKVQTTDIDQSRDTLLGQLKTGVRAVQAIAAGNIQVNNAAALLDKLDALAANLEAMAARPISVRVDGQEIIRATANSPTQRRSPR